MPEIVKRSEKDITKLIPGDPRGKPKSDRLDYFWDYAHLNNTLATYCPQMRVYQSMNELWDVPSVLSAFTLSVSDLRVPLDHGSVMKNMTEFTRKLHRYVEMASPTKRRTAPVRFNLIPTTYVWATAADSPSLVKNWGRILRVRRDIRELAASILFALQKKFKLRLDPRNSTPIVGTKRRGFVGVHLRTEGDDAEGTFPSYETQAAYYLDFAARVQAPVVFLATGATDDNSPAFALRAKDFNVTVVRKEDLLVGEELDFLENQLSYDQRTLVDYEIMLRAGLIAATSESSLAWNLAMRRVSAFGGIGNSTPTYGGSNIAWQDQYTTIYGHSRVGRAMRSTIWP
jgi:hypothetical protein